MSDNPPFLIVVSKNEEAIAWAIQRLNRAGLQVLRTFDLKVARLSHTECPCPHHGNKQCDCQIVVLLVYGGEKQPVSMVAHSFDGRTLFFLVDAPQQPADPHNESVIIQVLISENSASQNDMNLCRVT